MLTNMAAAGFKHKMLSSFGLRKAPSKGPVDKGIMRSVTANPSPLSGAIPHKRLGPSVSISLAQSANSGRSSGNYGPQAGSHYSHQVGILSAQYVPLCLCSTLYLNAQPAAAVTLLIS